MNHVIVNVGNYLRFYVNEEIKSFQNVHFFHEGDPYHIGTDPLICRANGPVFLC